MQLILYLFFVAKLVVATEIYDVKEDVEPYGLFKKDISVIRQRRRQQAVVHPYVNEDSDIDIVQPIENRGNEASKRYAIKTDSRGVNPRNENESIRRNLVQFRDSSGRVIATLNDPRSWNNANVTLSRQDDAKRLIESMKGLYGKKQEVQLPKPRLYKQDTNTTNKLSIITEDEKNKSNTTVSSVKNDVINVPEMIKLNYYNGSMRYQLKPMENSPIVTIDLPSNTNTHNVGNQTLSKFIINKTNTSQNSSLQVISNDVPIIDQVNKTKSVNYTARLTVSNNITSDADKTSVNETESTPLNNEIDKLRNKSAIITPNNKIDVNENARSENKSQFQLLKPTMLANRDKSLSSSYLNISNYATTNVEVAKDTNKTIDYKVDPENSSIKSVKSNESSNDLQEFSDKDSSIYYDITKNLTGNISNSSGRLKQNIPEMKKDSKLKVIDKIDFESGDSNDAGSANFIQVETSGDDDEDNYGKANKRNYETLIGEKIRLAKLEMVENEDGTDHEFVEDFPEYDTGDAERRESTNIDESAKEVRALNHDTEVSMRPFDYHKNVTTSNTTKNTTNQSFYQIAQEETKRLEIYGTDGELDMIEESNMSLPIKNKSFLDENAGTADDNPTQSVVITNQLYEAMANMRKNRSVTTPDLTGEELYQKFLSMTEHKNVTNNAQSLQKGRKHSNLKEDLTKDFSDNENLSDSYYFPPNYAIYGKQVENPTFNGGVNTDDSSSKHFKIVGSIDPLSNVEYNDINGIADQQTQYFKDQIIKNPEIVLTKMQSDIVGGVPYNSESKKTHISTDLEARANILSRPKEKKKNILSEMDTDVFQVMDKRDTKTPDDYFESFDEVDPVNKDVSMVSEVDSNEISKRSKIFRPLKKKSKKLSSKEAHSFLKRKTSIEYPSEDSFFHRAAASSLRHSEEHSLYRNNVRHNILVNSNDDEINEISEILDDSVPTKKMSSTVQTTPQTSTSPIKPTTRSTPTVTHEIILKFSTATRTPKLHNALSYDNHAYESHSPTRENYHHESMDDSDRVSMKADTTDRLPRFHKDMLKEDHEESKYGDKKDIKLKKDSSLEPLRKEIKKESRVSEFSNKDTNDRKFDSKESHEKQFDRNDSRGREFDNDESGGIKLDNKDSRDNEIDSRKSRDKEFDSKEFDKKGSYDDYVHKNEQSSRHKEKEEFESSNANNEEKSRDKEGRIEKQYREHDENFEKERERKLEHKQFRYDDDSEDSSFHSHDDHDDNRDEDHDFDEDVHRKNEWKNVHHEREPMVKEHHNDDNPRESYRFDYRIPDEERDDNIYKSKFDRAYPEMVDDESDRSHHHKNMKDHSDYDKSEKQNEDKFHDSFPRDDRKNEMSDPFEDYEDAKDYHKSHDHRYEKDDLIEKENASHDHSTEKNGHTHNGNFEHGDNKLTNDKDSAATQPPTDNNVKIHVNVITPDSENVAVSDKDSGNAGEEKIGNPIKTGTQRSREMENDGNDKSDVQPTRININLHLKQEEDEEEGKADEDKIIESPTQKQDNVLTLPIDIVPSLPHNGKAKASEHENPSKGATLSHTSFPTDHITTEMLKETLKDAFRDLAKENLNADKAKKLLTPVPYKTNKVNQMQTLNSIKNWHNDMQSLDHSLYHTPSLRSTFNTDEKSINSMKNLTGPTNAAKPSQESPTRRKSRLEHEEDNEENKKHQANVEEPTKESKTVIPKSYHMDHEVKLMNKSEPCNCEPTSAFCHCRRVKPTISENSQRRQDATFPPQISQDCFPPNSPACHLSLPILQNAMPYEQPNSAASQEQYNPAFASFASALPPFQTIANQMFSTSKSMLPIDKFPQVQYPNPLMHLPSTPPMMAPVHSPDIMPGIQLAFHGSTIIPQPSENCNGGVCNCMNPPCFPPNNQFTSSPSYQSPPSFFPEPSNPLLQTGGTLNIGCPDPPCPQDQDLQNQQQFQTQQPQQLQPVQQMQQLQPQPQQPQLQQHQETSTTPTPYCGGSPCFYDPFIEQCLHPPCPPIYNMNSCQNPPCNDNSMPSPLQVASTPQSLGCQCAPNSQVCQCNDLNQNIAPQQTLYSTNLQQQQQQNTCPNPPCDPTCSNPTCLPPTPLPATPAPPAPNPPPPPPSCPPLPCLPPCITPPECTPPTPIRLIVKKLPTPKKFIRIVEKPSPPKFILATTQPQPQPKIILLKAPEPVQAPPILPPEPLPQPPPLPPPQPRIIYAQQSAPSPQLPQPPLPPPRRIIIQQAAPPLKPPSPPPRIVYAMPQQTQINSAPPITTQPVQSQPQITSNDLIKSLSSLLSQSRDNTRINLPSPQIQVPQIPAQTQSQVFLSPQQVSPRLSSQQTFSQSSFNVPQTTNRISLPVQGQNMIPSNPVQMPVQQIRNSANTLQLPNNPLISGSNMALSAPKFSQNNAVVGVKQNYARPLMSSFRIERPNFANKFNDRAPMSFSSPKRKPIWNPDIYSRQTDLSLNCFQNPSRVGCGAGFQMPSDRKETPDSIEQLVKGMSKKAEDQGDGISPDIEERISDAVAEAIVEVKKNYNKSKEKNNSGKKNNGKSKSEAFEQSGLARNYIASASGALLPYYEILLKAKKDLGMLKPERNQVMQQQSRYPTEMSGPFTSVASINNAKASDIKAEIFNRFLRNKKETSVQKLISPVIKYLYKPENPIISALQMPHFENKFERTTKSSIGEVVRPTMSKRRNLTNELKLVDKLNDEKLLNGQQKKIVASIARTVASIQNQLAKNLKHQPITKGVTVPSHSSAKNAPLNSSEKSTYTPQKQTLANIGLQISSGKELNRYHNHANILQHEKPIEIPRANPYNSYPNPVLKDDRYKFVHLIPVRTHSLSLKVNMTNSLPVLENDKFHVNLKNSTTTIKSSTSTTKGSTSTTNINHNVPFTTLERKTPNITNYLTSHPILNSKHEFDFSDIHVTGPSNIDAFEAKKQPIRFDHSKNETKNQLFWSDSSHTTTRKYFGGVDSKQVSLLNAFTKKNLRKAEKPFDLMEKLPVKTFQQNLLQPVEQPSSKNKFSNNKVKKEAPKKVKAPFKFLSRLSDSALLMLHEKLKTEVSRLKPITPSKKSSRNFETPQLSWQNREHMQNALLSKYGNYRKNYEHILLKKSNVNSKPMTSKYKQVEYQIYPTKNKLKPTMKRFFAAHRKLLSGKKLTPGIIMDVEDSIRDITKQLEKKNKFKDRKRVRSSISKHSKSKRNKHLKNKKSKKNLITINITDD